jgi:hypothetical protein
MSSEQHLEYNFLVLKDIVQPQVHAMDMLNVAMLVKRHQFLVGAQSIVESTGLLPGVQEFS